MVQLLLSCMNCTWLLENPSTSLMFHYKRVKQVVAMLIKAGFQAWGCQKHFHPCRSSPPGPQVTKISIWMQLWGHPTPKRTTLLSSSKLIHKLQTGKLIPRKASIKTSHKYFNAKGEQRFRGSKELRSTQFPAFMEPFILDAHTCLVELHNAAKDVPCPFCWSRCAAGKGYLEGGQAVLV